MIDLYYWPTPNGHKVTILLEECGIPYTIKPVNIGRGDQLSPSFLKISRNGRMPAIVDHEPLGGSAPLTIFESGAIMMYLAEKAGRFWPQEPHHKYEVVQWILWQMANQGPKFGEQGHFHCAAQDPKNGDQAYANLRFDNPDEELMIAGISSGHAFTTATALPRCEPHFPGECQKLKLKTGWRSRVNSNSRATLLSVQ